MEGGERTGAVSLLLRRLDSFRWAAWSQPTSAMRSDKLHLGRRGSAVKSLRALASTLAILPAAVALAPLPASAQEPADTTNADSASTAPKPDPGPTRTIEFDVDEGTWMNLDVSPDGSTILFDLLGDLYTVPVEGGEATLLLGGRDWDHQPRYSPDGDRIAFISDRDGMMNLWVANAVGTELKQLSRDKLYPSSTPLWAPDGQVIAVRQSATEPSLYSYYLDGGSGYRLPVSGDIEAPELSPDSRYLYLAGMRRVDRVAGDTVSIGDGSRPKVSPDGSWLAYARPNASETALHIRDLRSGLDRRLVDRITRSSTSGVGEIPNYAFTPDSRSIILSIDGKIHRVDVESGQSEEIPFRAHVSQEVVEPIRVEHRVDDGDDLRVRIIRWPSLSPDGRRVAFGAVGKVWIGELTGEAVAVGDTAATPPPVRARRLTNSTAREYAPSYSPDGRWIAYTTWTDTAFGHVMVAPAEGGEPRAVTAIAGRYANPVWSGDGQKLAFLRGGGVEARRGQPEQETYFDVMWAPIEGGEPRHITTTVPSRAHGFPMRYYPVIAFSADGTRVYFSQWSARGKPGETPKATLYSIRLDGTDRREHITTTALDEIVPSPDGRRVAFVRREQVIVAALPPLVSSAIELDLDNGAVPVQNLTKTGGNYVSWLDTATVAWVFANKLYRQRLDQDSAEIIGEIALTLPRAKPSGTVAFTNARIITMKGDEVIPSGTVLVENNRIRAVGPSVPIPPDAEVFDAAGKTIMPGLVDVHAHMHYHAFEAFPQQKWEYVVNLAYGVTTTFDPSAHNLDVFAQQEMVEAGEMLGPRIFSTGDVILGRESLPVVYENIQGLEDARTVVKRFKAYSPEMLKQYMQPRRDQRQWIIQAAREEGIMVTAEGGGDLVLDLTMVLDGYTAFEHSLPIAPLYNDVIELVARSRVHYTPTLIVAYGGPTLENYFVSKSDIYNDPKLRRFTPEANLERFRRWEHIPDEEQHWLKVSQAAAAIAHAGGNVSLGAHGNRQGLGAHWELWGLQMGGLTNHQALRAGTLTGAEKIGYAQDLGSIEPGKLADFLVLHANPLDDIRNTAEIQYTVKNGYVFDAESMTEVWPEPEPLQRFFWQTQPEDPPE